MPSRDLELPNEITLPYAKFLGGGEPARIARNIRLELTEHTYLPKAHDPRADWVACVGVPAFRAMRDLHPQGVGHFATIGTGAGMDALAAIEILNRRTVTMTDLHQDVVDAALRNVTGNLAGGHAVTLQGEVGELLQPLARSGRTYDLIYENLPNIPLPEGQELKDGMVSSKLRADRPGNRQGGAAIPARACMRNYCRKPSRSSRPRAACSPASARGCRSRRSSTWPTKRAAARNC